jgi:LysM repeat protein
VTARALAQIPENQRLDFKAYKIRKGDRLARVAARFNLSTEDLLTANDMTSAQFRPGKVIKVPPPPTTPIDNRDLLSKVERARTIEDRPLENLPGIPVEGSMPALDPARVQPGAAPARPEDVEEVPSAPAPAHAAASVPEVVPTRPRAAVRETTGRAQQGKAAQAKAPVRPVQESRPAFHVVKRGETLFAISERYGIDIKDLRKWNRIKKAGIQVGQRLRLIHP